MTDNVPYFSEEEEKGRPWTEEKIDQAAWGGIRAQISARIDDGSFGEKFPMNCNNGGGVIASNEELVSAAMRSEIPSLEELPWYIQSVDLLRTMDILDMVQFCWRNISKSIRTEYDRFCGHHHLRFDKQAGQSEFRDTINRIFRRNHLAYELTEEGAIRRLVTPVLHEMLSSAHFNTGNSDLDNMLEKSCEKFLYPDKETRYEALKTLWAAWECLKALEETDKKKGISNLLGTTAGLSSPKFRKALECDANDLTDIGNRFHIRHSETNQERLKRSEHIDYLFHRLFSLIQLILRTNRQHRS